MAKHFPFPWFESLIGGYDPTIGHLRAGAHRADGRAAGPTATPTTSPTSTARPMASSRTCRTTRCRPSAGSPPTTAATPTTRPARATTSRAPSASTRTARQPERPDLPTRRPARLRPRGDDAEELHRRPVRLGPVPRLLHPAHRGLGGVRPRPDRRHLRRGRAVVHLLGQQLQQRLTDPNGGTAPAAAGMLGDRPPRNNRLHAGSAHPDLRCCGHQRSRRGLDLRCLRHLGRRRRREHRRHERQRRALRPELDARDERVRRPALSRPGQQLVHRPAAGVHLDEPRHAGGLRSRHRPRRLGDQPRGPHRRCSAGVSGSSSSSTITDNSIIGDDTGRAVTSITVGGTAIVSGTTPTPLTSPTASSSGRSPTPARCSRPAAAGPPSPVRSSWSTTPATRWTPRARSRASP